MGELVSHLPLSLLSLYWVERERERERQNAKEIKRQSKTIRGGVRICRDFVLVLDCVSVLVLKINLICFE